MTFDARVQAVAKTGFTERQARFLVTVMLHSGVCVPRQYATFCSIVHGQKTRKFFAKLVRLGYTSMYDCRHNRARIYHINQRALYRAIDDVESRLRRPLTLSHAIQRLMLLDAIVESPELVWLGTAEEKAAHLTALTAIDPEDLPHVTTGEGDTRTVRYFPERLPIGIHVEGRGVLVYVVSDPVLDECRAFLERHAPVLRALRAWTLRIVVPSHLPEVGQRAKQVVWNQLLTPLRPQVFDELCWYFEQAQTHAAPSRSHNLDERFFKARDAFSAPRFKALYRVWKRDGDLANPKMEGVKLEQHYRDTLRKLGEQGGMLGLIFSKAQNKIQDPAKLRRLVVDLIGNESWLEMSSDVKGDAYEGLLERNAQDTKSGAGQYFTPRSLIDALVDCVRPVPGEIIADPACGTGGFLLSAHTHVATHYKLDKDQKRYLRYDALRGVELVDGVARLCTMNLFLHGIGPDDGKKKPPIKTDDALRSEPSELVDVVLTNPPFGKKSSITVINDEGETDKESITYNRPDFWTTTSNKQLNFVQHVKSMLKIPGRAAVVVPDNVLFEGGAGEKVRRKLLQECEVHTLLRLPTGIFYAQGVKANVIFFDRKPGAKEPWTKKVWIYDCRTNKEFTLKERRMVRADLDEFVECYHPENRHQRKPTWDEKKNSEGRWRTFTYEEIVARDKCSLDIFWLKDESLEDSSKLPDPHVLAADIAEDLRSALEQIESVLGDLKQRANIVEGKKGTEAAK